MCTLSPACERALHEVRARPGAEDQLPRQNVHRLVLAIVILQAQNVASLDVENLADVAISEGPDQLVAPRLVHPVWHFGHEVSFRVERRRRKSRRNIGVASHQRHPSSLPFRQSVLARSISEVFGHYFRTAPSFRLTLLPAPLRRTRRAPRRTRSAVSSSAPSTWPIVPAPSPPASASRAPGAVGRTPLC